MLLCSDKRNIRTSKEPRGDIYPIHEISKPPIKEQNGRRKAMIAGIRICKQILCQTGDF